MIKYLYTFFISMLPIVELRGAIPVGAASGLPWYINYLLCCVGNMLPVPIILFFVEIVLNYMKKIKYLDKIALWVEEKADKHKDSADHAELFAES